MANHPNAESTTGTMVLEWFKINSRGCAGLFGTLHVPCRVSNVRRMSPRRASVRPKAFKCTHEPRSSAALFRVQRRTVQFVGVEVKSGSDDVALDAM